MLSGDYCEVCECDPCDCNWGHEINQETLSDYQTTTRQRRGMTMKLYTKPVKCSLCNAMTIDTHSAKPLNNGSCCAACNQKLVIPARLLQYSFNKQVRDYIKANGRVKARAHFKTEYLRSDNVLYHQVIESFFDMPAVYGIL